MTTKDRYFTAGELASSYGITKQTLLHYDKNKLLIPEFTNEKGYRFYSEVQYHVLEIILNMRALDICVQDIKEYLQGRDIDNLEHILREREKECEELIKYTVDTKTSLKLFLKALERIKQAKPNQIELATQSKKLLLVSEILTENISPKERLEIFSRHNQAAFCPQSFKEFSNGWIIDKDKFFAEKFNKTMRYFTPVSHFKDKESPFSFVRPAGLYLTMCFKGTFYEEITGAFKKIQAFMNRNNLKAIDDVYIFPLKNYWLTKNTQEYINEISFKVEYVKEN